MDMAKDVATKAKEEGEVEITSSSWKKYLSKSRPGKAYMFNQSTGETKWCGNSQSKDGHLTEFNLPDLKVLKKNKTPAQDRLKRLQKRLKTTTKEKSTVLNNNAKKIETKEPISFTNSPKNGTKKLSEKVNSIMESFKLKTTAKPKLPNSETESKPTVITKNVSKLIETKVISNISKLTKSAKSTTTLKTVRKSIGSNREKPYDISKRTVEIPNTCITLKVDSQNDVTNNTTAEIHKLNDNCSNKQLSFSTAQRIQPLRNNAAIRLDQLRNSLSSKETLAKCSDVEKTEDNGDEFEPMDWECSDLDTKIENNSNSIVKLPETMGEYYDDINHNLMRLAAERAISKDRLHSKWLKKHYYFVVDTNIFFRNLTFIDELCAMKLCDTIGSIIYVPYIVLQELDKLKMREPTVTLATRAIRYLNRKLEETNFQAQSALQEKDHLIVVHSPDDNIINCCLQVQNQVNHVLLLTEDVNLQNKALSNNLLVSNKSELISMKPSSSLR